VRIDTVTRLCYTDGMSTKVKDKALPDVLRAYVQRDGRSLYALADACGIARGTLSRFVRGERDFTLGTADRLCRALGLELRPVRRGKAKGR